MKRIAICFVLILASIACGQADSCNMSLVSNWVGPYWGTVLTTGVGLAMKDSIVYYTYGDALFILSVSETGVLAFIDSLNLSELGTPVVFDEYLFVVSRIELLLFDISTSYSPSLINTIPYWTKEIHQEDSIYYLDCAKWIYKFCINSSDSFYLLDSCEIPGTSGTAFVDWDLMINYDAGAIWHGEEPDIRYEPFFRIHDISDFSSVTTIVDTNFWSEYEYDDASGPYFVMDTLMLIKGPDRQYYFLTVDSLRTTAAIHEPPLEDFFTFHNDIICDTILVNSALLGIDIGRIVSGPSYELLAKYLFESTDTSSHLIWDFCVKDSFIYAIDEFYVRGHSESCSLTVKTFKFRLDPLEGIDETAGIPEQHSITVHPNPFNAACKITVPAGFKASICDVQGRQVCSLPEGTSVWNAEGQPSGVYLVVMQSGREKLTRKIALIRREKENKQWAPEYL